MTELTVGQPLTPSTEFSVKTHFTHSWSIFKATALRMFLLQLIVTVLSFLMITVFFGFVFYVILANPDVSGVFESLVKQQNPEILMSLPGWYWQTVGYSVLFLVLVFTLVIMPLNSAGYILAVADTEKKLTFGQLLAKSIRLIPRVAILLSVLFVINFGTLWFFLLPSLIVSVLLSFGIYEMVLENKGVTASFRSSLALVKNDFWLVLGRSLLLGVIYLVVFSVMPSLLGSIDPSLSSIYNVISFIPSFMSSWFAVAYTMALYKYLKQKTAKKSEPSMAWIWLLTVAGWLIFTGLAMGMVRLINSPEVRQAIREEWADMQKEATSAGQLEMDWDYDENVNFEYSQTEQSNFAPKQPTAYPTKRQTTLPTCTNYNIREGEFASNKCYTEQDYDDLFYYLGRFQSTQSQLRGAEASIEITCNGSDFFKQSCEKAQADKTAAEADLAKYRSTIQAIIARGK